MDILQWPDIPSWEKLIKESPSATFFHMPLWHEIIVKTYKKYSIATREITFDDGLKAVLPLIETGRRGVFFKGKSRLKSSVFGGYGGLISSAELSRDRQFQVYYRLAEQKASISVSTSPFEVHHLPDPYSCQASFTQVFPLISDEEMSFRCLSRGAKSNLKQAQKRGLSVRTARTEEDLSAYYAIYRDTLRRWGRDVIYEYPEELFLNIFKMGGDSAKIWLAEKADQIIAGAVIFYCNTNVFYWHGASLKGFFSCYPNNLLHMEIIKDAAKRGYRNYDFGPSGGQEGVERFKKSFGSEKRPYVLARFK